MDDGLFMNAEAKITVMDWAFISANHDWNRSQRSGGSRRSSIASWDFSQWERATKAHCAGWRDRATSSSEKNLASVASSFAGGSVLPFVARKKPGASTSLV